MEQHNEQEYETKIEKVDIVEDEKPGEGGEEKESRAWREEFQVAGGELVDFLKKMTREATVRRIIVRNKHGRTLLDIPVAVGAVGLLPPLLMWSALAFGAAVLTSCSVTIERVDHVPAEKESEAEAPPEDVVIV